MPANAPDVGFAFGHEGDDSLLAVIQRLREEMKQLRQQQDELKSSALDLSGAWKQLVGLAAALKLAEFSKSAFESVIQVGRLSAATGISTQTLSTFRKATEDAGLSQEIADTAVKRLARSILSLEQGNRKTAATFALLRDEAGKPITSKSFQGLTDDQKFLKVVDAIGRMKGGLDTAGISAQLLGRNSAELLAVLQRLSGGGFAEVQAQARALGLEVTPEMVKAFTQAKESIENLKGAATGMAMQFETGLVPQISQAADAMVNVIAKTKDGESAFQRMGETAGYWIKLIIGGLIELGIWAKAVGATVLESIGGAFEEVGNAVITPLKAGWKAVTLDFKGAWNEVKDGAHTAASIFNDVTGNAKDRFAQAFESERKLLEGLNGQVKHSEPPKIGTNVNASAGAAANAAKLQMQLDRAKLESQKAAAHDELEIYKANAQQREGSDREAYERGLISLKEYFARRRAEIQKERDLEISALGGEKTGLQGLLGKAEKLPVAPGDAGGEIRKQEEILKIKQQIHEIDTKIELARIHAGTQTDAVNRTQFQQEKDHQTRKLEFEKQIAELEGNQQRVNALKNQIEDLHNRKELEDLGYEEAAIDRLLAQLSRARNLRTGASEAQKGFEGGRSDLENKRADIQERVASGNLQPYQAERLLRNEIQSEIPILEEKVRVIREAAAAAASPELRAELTKQADQDEAAIRRLRAEAQKLGQEWKNTIKSSMGQISQTLFTGFNGWIQGHESFGRAVMQTWNGIVMHALNAIEQIGAKWLEQHLLMKAFNAIFRSEQVATDTGANVASSASDAAAAAAATLAYYSATAPEIAPEMAEIQYGIGMSFAGAAMMRSGGLIAKSLFGGGHVSGPGSSTSDSVPVWASNGEYMINARSAAGLGTHALDMLNQDPELFTRAMRGANLPPINFAPPYGAYTLGLQMPGREIEPRESGPTFHHTTQINGDMSALDGASMKAMLQEHEDTVGRIAVEHVKRYFRNGGVNR